MCTKKLSNLLHGVIFSLMFIFGLISVLLTMQIITLKEELKEQSVEILTMSDIISQNIITTDTVQNSLPSYVTIRDFYTLENDNNKNIGGGVLISEDGYILTAYHVVENQIRTDITVKETSKTYSSLNGEVTLIKYDEDLDLALLKINADTKFQFSSFGDSDLMKVGDKVFAIGSPSPNSSPRPGIVSTGIVSLNIIVVSESGIEIPAFHIDAAINPGNSGGPLFNAEGKLIGIILQKSFKEQDGSSDYIMAVEGISTAIRINTVKEFLQDELSLNSN